MCNDTAYGLRVMMQGGAGRGGAGHTCRPIIGLAMQSILDSLILEYMLDARGSTFSEVRGTGGKGGGHDGAVSAHAWS